jgi:hypothetical protein
LSKKRDALRRGIRDLIADTTKELAAFEGREPAPRPEPASVPSETAPRDLPPLNGSTLMPAADRQPPDGDLRAAAETGAHAAAPQTVPFELITETVLFPRPAAPAEGGAGAQLAPGPAPQAAKRRPSTPSRTRAARAGKTREKAPRRGGGRRGKRARRATRPPASRAAAPAPARSAAPADDNVAAETGQPEPAEPRTGVCRSYFVSHECWRFAKKFKHLW